MLFKNGLVEHLVSGRLFSERVPLLHPRRCLDSFVLLYGVKGTLYISDGGNQYAMSPNEYLILAANREHAGTKYSSQGLTYYWCHFYLNCNYKLKYDEDGREYLEIENGRLCIPMYGVFTESSKLHLLFHQLIDSSKSFSDSSKFISGSFLEIILAEISSAEYENSKTKASMLTENIMQWIKLNACQISSVGDIANNFGYNSEYLTTMIRKSTGKTLTEHINEIKVARACELLRMTVKSVKEIAYECGYSDEKYFLRVFKKYRDITPKEYRNTYVKQNNN